MLYSLNTAPPMAAPLIAFIVLFVSVLATGTLGESSGPVKYTYSGDTGPSRWGILDPKFSLCAKGTSQSPIDIPKRQAVLNKALKPLVRDYHAVNASLADNLVNIGLHFGPNSGVLISDGKQYQLKNMHWHTPSEHSIDGVHYDAELHLVHLADDGSYAAVGILYRLGRPNPLVALIQKKLPLLANKVRGYGYHTEIPLGTFSMMQLQKMTREYYKYHGSFTTPPCTETVDWYVLGEVESISKEQIEALKLPLGPEWKSNARPVQPLHGRQIQLYKEVIPPRKTNQQ